MSDSQRLIQFAQNYLKNQPFDIVHDFEHHQLVVQNCAQVIAQEKLKLDEDLLFTSAWWHDVEKSYETTNSADSTLAFFKKNAKQLETDADFVERCCVVIGEHSFTETQNTLESKILFDADKIEYVNANRIEKLIQDFKEKPEHYDPKNLQQAYDVWMYRLPRVHAMMHFSYSRQLFESKLTETYLILEELKKSL